MRHLKNNIDDRGKETCSMIGLPIYNKNSAVNVLLPLLFDFLIIATVYLTKLSFFNIRFLLF